MWWKIALFVAMSTMIVASFFTKAPMTGVDDPEVFRIMYYHVPQAWICVLAFLMSMVFSIRYLKSKSLHDDDNAAVAAGLGFLFCAMAAVSGSIFAKMTWGSFWNWDPRETSIFILLLIYGAYFALRGAVEVEEKRASLAAVYSIFAFVTVPFLIFVVPRIVQSLHPEDTVVGTNMGPIERIVFFSSLGLFTVVFLWLFDMARRVQNVKRLRLEREL